jgi:hypothetical protein
MLRRNLCESRAHGGAIGDIKRQRTGLAPEFGDTRLQRDRIAPVQQNAGAGAG